MKEYLAGLLRSSITSIHGRNLVREYLQARILGSLQRAGAMVPLAFQGGTALRFLYAIPRYSEDLDFALERPAMGYDFRGYVQRIQTEMAQEGYQVEVKVSDQRVVHNAFIRFRGLLFELGLSPQRDEVIAVKLEVDTNPPAGAGLATSVVRRHVVLQLQHYDQSSMLAGKLHAVLQRPYPKGRDMYDLLWYLSDPSWPEPNILLLNNALQQTGWTRPVLTSDDWRSVVAERVQELPWEQVAGDVRPFLESGQDAEVLRRENLLRLLRTQ